MEKRISVLAAFLFAGLIAGFATYQLGLETGKKLFPSPDAIPSNILSIGPLIQIVILVLIYRYLKATSGTQRLFPRLYSGTHDNSKLAYDWEKISAICVLGFPIIGFTYFWVRFLTDDEIGAWIGRSAVEVGLFQWVEGCHFFDKWNACKIGSIATLDGDSFVPFWQPVLIMGGGCLVVLVLTMLIARAVLKRAPLRRRTMRMTKS